MRRMLVASLALILLACGSSEPGNISVSLNFANTVDTSPIVQFVFLVGQESQKLLFPSTCLGTAADGTSCLKEASCGFDAASDTSFQFEINFADIGDGDTMIVEACALDSTQTPIAGGSDENVPNTDGTVATVTLNSTVIDCINDLPPLCP